MYKIMTPGPTQVAENVRLARSKECTNPDLDTDFVEFYKETCEEISRLLHTENETLILGGEGILGLEAACASMTEPGDRVLVLDNGIYGRGFADFVSMYGGKPELYSRDYRETLDVQELENFLKDHHDYKYATVVHGDTPSGMLNDISAICPLLKKYGIMTVVDSVSASFGEPMRISDWKVDIMCGGSQKVISAIAYYFLAESAGASISSFALLISSFASFTPSLKLFTPFPNPRINSGIFLPPKRRRITRAIMIHSEPLGKKPNNNKFVICLFIIEVY